MEKELRFIVNGVGELLDCNYRKLVARDKHTNIIQVIAPFNIDTRVFANIDVMASIKETRSELLSYKGKTESGFSIFEAELSQPNTKFISRHSSGSILISLSFSEKVIPKLATNYKGKFNLVNPLPLSAIDGDYYEADGGWQDDLYYYAFDKWVKGDIAYWYNGKWRRANYKLLANMSVVEIPVEPSIEVKQPIEEDELLILTLAGDVAKATDRVGLVEIELTQQEDRIYNAELEAERLDDVKAEKSEVAISFAEVNDELIDINKELLRLEEDKTDKDELSEVAFSGLYDDLENTPTIPSISGLATEQWVLNKHYLTAHQSLADYYKKSEVNNLISQIPKFKILIVEELPSADIDLMAIYVVGSSGKEYIYLESEERWELIGSLEVDLSNYYTKTEVNGLLEDKVDKVEGKGLSTNDYTNTDKQSVEKIPTIEQDILDLESDKVDKNNAITAGTKTKITYDAKGLVTGGADLTEADIPPLSASKITQDANNKFVTDTEKSTWNGKQNALTAGDGISIVDDVISANGVITVEEWDSDEKTLALSDANKLFRCSSTGNKTLTIPPHNSVPFPIGTMITFVLINPGKITFVGASDVFINSMDSLVELATPNGMASLIKTYTNAWQLVGALE